MLRSFWGIIIWLYFPLQWRGNQKSYLLLRTYLTSKCCPRVCYCLDSLLVLQSVRMMRLWFIWKQQDIEASQHGIVTTSQQGNCMWTQATIPYIFLDSSVRAAGIDNDNRIYLHLHQLKITIEWYIRNAWLMQPGCAINKGDNVIHSLTIRVGKVHEYS